MLTFWLCFRTNIKSVPVISDDNLPNIPSDNSTGDILSSLQADVRQAIEKSRRVETAADILFDAKETLQKSDIKFF